MKAHIVRTSDRTENFEDVEIHDLQDIILLIEKYDNELIIHYDADEHAMLIEIYDDYRE